MTNGTKVNRIRFCLGDESCNHPLAHYGKEYLSSPFSRPEVCARTGSSFALHGSGSESPPSDALVIGSIRQWAWWCGDLGCFLARAHRLSQGKMDLDPSKFAVHRHNQTLEVQRGDDGSAARQ